MIKVRTNLFRAAAMCISREATRYYLNGVYIEPHHEKGALLVATDGHRLLAAYDDEAVCDKAAIVSPTMLKMAERLWIDPSKAKERDVDDDDEWDTELDPRKPPPELLIVDDQGRMELGAIKSTESVIIDGKFPDWRRVFPTLSVERPPLPILNINLAIDFGMIAGLLRPGQRAVQFVSGADGNGPALVLFPNVANAFGILMPMKGDAQPAEIPQWALLPKPSAIAAE